MDSFFKGEDFELEMYWKDVSGDPLPPSTLVDYKVQVVFEFEPTSVKLIFAKTPGQDEKSIEVTDDSAGKLTLRFERDWSSAAKNGKYYLKVFRYYEDLDGIDDKHLEIIKVNGFNLID